MKTRPIAAGKSSFDLIDVATLMDALQLDGEPAVLDLACGVGNYAIEIAHAMRGHYKVWAFDLWEEGIGRLTLKAGSLGLDNIEAHVADVTRKIALDDDSIDICLMATVLHDLIAEGSHQGALEEIARILAPDGRLAVVEFKKMPGPPGPPEKVRLSPGQLEQVLAPWGFSCRTTVDLGATTYLSMFDIAPV